MRESFILYLFAAFSKADVPTIELLIPQLKSALKENNISQFCTSLQSLFAHIPYQLHVSQERYYHSLFQLLGILLGFETQSEVATDKGRIDTVILAGNYVYLFETKIGTSAKTALKQIEDKKYFERYSLTGKTIVLVGMSFNRSNDKLTIDCASKVF